MWDGDGEAEGRLKFEVRRLKFEVCCLKFDFFTHNHNYMPTIKKFEDLEVWQLARVQANDFTSIVNEGSLSKDFELRNQMNASSGSVMDGVAEGFERSGNNEFKSFLVIAKGSNGEFRSQLYRCLDRKHIADERFNELYNKNVVIGNKLMSFINYLQHSDFKGQRYKKQEPAQPQTPSDRVIRVGSNLKPQT